MSHWTKLETNAEGYINGIERGKEGWRVMTMKKNTDTIDYPLHSAFKAKSITVFFFHLHCFTHMHSQSHCHCIDSSKKRLLVCVCVFLWRLYFSPLIYLSTHREWSFVTLTLYLYFWLCKKAEICVVRRIERRSVINQIVLHDIKCICVFISFFYG